MFRITLDLPHLTFAQLTHLLSRRRSNSLASTNGSTECLEKTLSKSSLEPLSHNFRRLRLGLGDRPHFRSALDLLPELSRSPRRRLASSGSACSRRLAHSLRRRQATRVVDSPCQCEIYFSRLSRQRLQHRQPRTYLRVSPQPTHYHSC